MRTSVRHVVAATCVILLGVFLSQPAFAAPIGPDAQADSVFSLDPFTVTILFGLVIPLVNGVVTKVSTPSSVKAIITIVLSAVAAIINTSITESGGAVFSQQTLKSWALQLVVSIVTYLGVFKPLEVTSSLTKDGTPGKLAGIGLTDPTE